MIRTDPELIAARLGIDVAVIRRIQERGYLRRLDLRDEEIRARLYAAHVAFACSSIRGVTVRIGSTDTYPYVVGVYVCTCGATVEQRGAHACEAPDGWVNVTREDEPDYVCPGCVPETEPALHA